VRLFLSLLVKTRLIRSVVRDISIIEYEWIRERRAKMHTRFHVTVFVTFTHCWAFFMQFPKEETNHLPPSNSVDGKQKKKENKNVA